MHIYPSWSLLHAVVETRSESILCKAMHKRQTKPRHVPLRVCLKLTSVKMDLQKWRNSSASSFSSPSSTVSPDANCSVHLGVRSQETSRSPYDCSYKRPRQMLDDKKRKTQIVMQPSRGITTSLGGLRR